MKYDLNKHHRRSIRLQGYDYSTPGAYFITLCAYQRQCLFGDVVDGAMELNPLGQIVVEEWLKSEEIRQEIELDAWVMMPNHFHGIVVIKPEDPINGLVAKMVGANGRSPLQGITSPMQPRSLSSFLSGFKAATTKRINTLRNTPRIPIWQRNYYEHIIRDDNALLTIRQYIQNNPCTWTEDQLHPQNPSKW